MFDPMAPPPGPRRSPETQQFAPRYDPLALLAVVRAVSSHAAKNVAPPKRPVDVTQAEYDEARGPAGYPGSKRAFRIAQQLNTSWARVLETAHLTGRQFTQTLVALEAAKLTHLNEEDVISALHAIALRLGVNTLRPDQYERELALVSLERGRAWLHAAGLTSLPSAGQIATQFGWDAALELAGLAPRVAAPLHRATHNPPSTWTFAPCVEALMRALDELALKQPGVKLTQPVYRQLATGRRDLPSMSSIAETAAAHGTTFSAIRDELIRWRVKGGKGEPAILKRARQLDALSPDTSAKDAEREARLQARASQPWAEELLAVLDAIGEPAPAKAISDQIGWPRDRVSQRLGILKEAGRVDRINLGKGTKTVRWFRKRAARPDAAMGDVVRRDRLDSA
jgi:hypothetical protein